MNHPAWEEIRSRCTEQSFERGVNYWNQVRIQELDIDGREVRATVRGSRDYDVSIDVENDRRRRVAQRRERHPVRFRHCA